MEQPKESIQIRAQDADLKGVYSNVAQIAHTHEEFVLDFFHIVGMVGVLASRVVLSPGHAKRLLEALKGQMSRYESQHGEVTPTEVPPGKIGFKID